MIESLLLALLGSGLVFVAGYFFGSKKGEEANAALSAENELLKEKLRSLQQTEKEREIGEKIEELVQEKLSQFTVRGENTAKMVEKYFQPLMEKERLGALLLQLRDQISSRHGLPEVLTEVGRTGGFLSILICDSTGLPLASYGKFEELDTVSGLASMLVMVADKFAQVGSSPPKEIILSDEKDQIILNRILRVRDELYLMMSLSQGRLIWPGMLDPVAPIVEEILAKDEWKITKSPD